MTNPKRLFKGIVTVDMDGSNRQRFAQTEADLFSITLVHGKDRVCASDTYKANIFCFDAKTGKMDKRYLMKITMITFVMKTNLISNNETKKPCQSCFCMKEKNQRTSFHFILICFSKMLFIENKEIISQFAFFYQNCSFLMELSHI